jgi:hypothetical protein
MMSVPTDASEFFVAGGALRPDAPSYVKRPEDDELLNLTLTSESCYVLTPRQMGKTSLMARTARRLQEQGVRTAIIDLTSIGTDVSAEQWYLGLITRLNRHLRLSVDPEAWWAERSYLSVVQRFTDFLHDVVLAEIGDPVVIFIDEIDTTLNLSFSDDFFAAIRFTYEARASDPAYNCLTFVLLGVAAPVDLIKDPSRTPFNIGHRIDLHEFSREDARVLEQGLEIAHPAQGKAIFDRIFYWTSGHPYLTQKLCLAVAEAENGRWTDERVDNLVEQLFLSGKARKETNLQFVRDKILNHPQHRQLFAFYRKVYKGKRVHEDERSLVQSQLRLAGLVKAEDGYLYIRNRIYRRAFDLAWVRENTPVRWIPIGLVGLGVFLGVVSVILWNALIPRICLPDQWCSQNGQNLKGKTVYALVGCDDGTLFAGTEDGIYRRTPGDPEWRLEQPTDGQVRGLDASPDCTLVYAAAQNHGVLRRYNGLWSLVSSPDMLQARTVVSSATMILAGGDFGLRYSMAGEVPSWENPLASPIGTVVSLVRSDGQVYAAAWGGGVWYCDEGNPKQWWPVSDGLDKALVLHTVGPLTNGAPKLVGVDDGFYRWNGTRWEKGPEPWGDTRTFWFVLDSATIYAGQENSGVLRSTDDGLRWKQINTGWERPPSQVRTLLIHVDENDRRWLYAGTSEGVWRILSPTASLCNGDFEHKFRCWQHRGELRQDVKCDRDQCYAVLGSPRYRCEGGVPVGEAWIKQTFTVPQTDSPTLSLRYRVFSYDLDILDFFQVSINGKPIGQFGNLEWNESSCNREVWDSGWQAVVFDLGPYRGERVEVLLRNVNGTYEWWNTWTYVDDVEVR